MTVKDRAIVTRWKGLLVGRLALEKAAKRRHKIAQSRLRAARIHDTHPRKALLDARDEASKTLILRRVQVAEARRVIARHGSSKPAMFTAKSIGLVSINTRGAKGTIFRGAWHYTAGPRARNKSQLIGLMRVYHQAHQSKGGPGLAYEAMIADDGTIGFGNPMALRSDGVAQSNTGLINICVPGTTGDHLKPAQIDSIRWLRDNWHTTAVPAVHRAPRPVKDLDWRGHREHFNNSACPGDMLPDYKRAWHNG